jgi:hypothetical protein
VNQSNNAGKTSAVVLQPAYRTLGLSSANSRRSATIGDNPRDIALGNIGSNYSCIPRRFLPSITQDGVKIPEIKLLSIYSLEGAVKNSHITANLCLYLQGIGPLTFYFQTYLHVYNFDQQSAKCPQMRYVVGTSSDLQRPIVCLLHLLTIAVIAVGATSTQIDQFSKKDPTGH